MFDSYPDKNPRKIGSYLNWVALATTCVSSSIFLTGAAPNPLALELSAKSGIVAANWGHMVPRILASRPYLVHHHSIVDLCILQARGERFS